MTRIQILTRTFWCWKRNRSAAGARAVSFSQRPPRSELTARGWLQEMLMCGMWYITRVVPSAGLKSSWFYRHFSSQIPSMVARPILVDWCLTVGALHSIIVDL